jgi:hypothetical protein
MNQYRIRDSCRLCGSISLTRVLQLPDTPLANEFMTIDERLTKQDTFPLYIVRCEICRHVQLPVIVDPVRLFRNYVYVSGTSPQFVAHFRSLALEVITKNGVPRGSLILEIGSNDGTGLRAFSDHGMRVLGVDPATNIANSATKAGIRTLPFFFTSELARDIRAREGRANVIVANNVFAHIDDLGEILDGVIELLNSDGGVFVFEVQYLPDMMEKCYFDMIYHEHLSYHSLAPLIPFLATKGLHVAACQQVDTHGGSIRVTATLGTPTDAQRSDVFKILEAETARLEQHSFAAMAARIEEAATDLTRMFTADMSRVWGFGAPAKMTTLFYSLKLDANRFEAIIDDSHLKQGLYTPGVHLPVISFEEFNRRARNSHEKIIIFAWNFASQIKERFAGNAHSLYTPLPRLLRLN